MALNVELWKRYIINNFYATNEFLKASTDVTSEVINGAIVHIPNAGAPAGAQRNRTSIPATSVRRSDNDVTYVLDNFTSDPVLVTAMEQADLSYQKMQSVIEDNGAAMQELAGSAILEYWARNLGSTEKQVTTGGTRAIPGLTGTRKKLTAADLRTAAAKMDADNVPAANRFVVITAEMKQDLLEDNDIKNTFTFAGVNYATGELPMYAGFKIIVRSRVLRYVADNSTTRLPDPGTATLATDNFAAIAFQKSCVEHALGTVDIFNRDRDPNDYGDTVSMLLRGGGRARRYDKKGVIALIQAA